MDRNIISIMSGQIVDFFDRDFRELYAISRELNLFKEFSINKRSTAASVRVTVPTRPTLPATSRFQVSLGDKGTLKVPAHKYHNPKYLLALGSLPDDLSSAHDLINKMEESRHKFAAEGNPMEDDEEAIKSQTPPSSLKGEKGTKVSCVPSKKKNIFSWKSKRNEAKEAGEGDAGPSATENLISPTGNVEGITEENTAETPTYENTKSKKKKKKRSKSLQSEDQGMFNYLLIKSNIFFSPDFGLLMMLGTYLCFPSNYHLFSEVDNWHMIKTKQLK